MARIHYETADGVDMIRREEYHAEAEPFLTAYNQAEGEPPADKVQIPLERIVRIHD